MHVYVCACLFILFMSPFLLLLTYYLSLLSLLFTYFLLLLVILFVKSTRIQTAENSEKENSEIAKIKQKIK